MSDLSFFMRQLPFFGVLAFGLFVALMTAFAVRPRRSLALYYIAFIALALGCGEAWLWFAETRDRTKAYFEGSYTSDHMRPDKDLGFALSPGPRRSLAIKRTRNGDLIYSVDYGVDANGLRVVPHNGTGPPIFFFGDSFTFGEGVEDDYSLPAQFARVSGYSVFNFGVHGYGPHQFLRMLETSRPEQMGIKREHALVVYSLLPTHIDRAAGRAMWHRDGPSYQPSSTGIEFKGPFPHEFADRIKNKSYIYKLIHPMLTESADRERVLSILVRANQIVEDRYGTGMLVIIWDGGLDARQNAPRAEWLRNSLANAHIANLSVSQLDPPLVDPTYYIAGDGHPGPAAYVQLAKAVLGYCSDMECLKHH